MKITPQVALEIAHHESCVLQAYKDSVGVWTWSIGLTNASGHNVERYIGKPQSLDKCLEVFVWALGKYAAQVEKAFQGCKLTEAQFAAALSFHWNTGAIGRASWVRHFKSGDVMAAKEAFMNYSKPKEIIPRRKAERDLFFDGVWSNRGKITVFGVTSRHTPAWSSAKKIDARSTLQRLLGGGATKPTPKSPTGGLLAAFLSLFRKA